MNIILHEPKIPFNTGNTGRTCVSTNTKLHLIKPLGFDTDEKAIKRAGLDYWNDIELYYYDSFEELVKKYNNPKIFMATTKAKNTYCEVKYAKEDFIMFGSESHGIPEDILLNYRDTCIRIPMVDKYRSLNLSTSVAIVLYEALRQNNFLDMKLYGDLHNNDWE